MITWIIIIVILGIAIFAFAGSVEREANRITLESGFRLESLDSLVESCNYFPGENREEVERLERKAARLKARAEEVAGRQNPGWKLYSKAIRKFR